jgi:hypothetical protein
LRPTIPTLDFERIYYDRLRSAVAFAADHLGVETPIQIEVGADATLDAALFGFFEKVYDATGYPRPRNFYDFPPSWPARPRG